MKYVGIKKLHTNSIMNYGFMHWLSDKMIRRVTITLDDTLVSKIRALQAKKISETKKSVSFSNVIEEVLKQGLKAYR